MKRAIGFRAESDCVHWAVVEGTKDAPVLVGNGVVPAQAGLCEAAVLSRFAERVHSLVNAHNPSAGMVRSIEPTAKPNRSEGPRRRLRVEGVLLQTMDACGLTASVGALATISGNLNVDSAKAFLDAKDCRGIDLSSLKPNTREAVLVAIAALP